MDFCLSPSVSAQLCWSGVVRNIYIYFCDDPNNPIEGHAMLR